MGGLLVATVTFTVLVALIVALLTAVTVVPVYAAVQLAEARRFSTTRWCAIATVTVLVGLGCSYVLHQHQASRILALLPLLLTWSAPVGLWLLDAGQKRLGGTAGAHE